MTYQIDFQTPARVHLIGIGGISMSGLAALFLDRGFAVSGSDSRETPVTQWLEGLGATVFYGHRASNLSGCADFVVYTAAVHPDNPEYARAVADRIPLLSRAQAYGQLMQTYQTPIAVAGTHGKTTTTSMLAHMLLETDLDPTISVGGMLPAIHGNFRLGHGGVFLTEACEYTNSFLEFSPKYAVILNIEADHLDFFRDLEDIRHSFGLFAKRLPKDGTLILNGAIPDALGLVEGLACNVDFFDTDDGYHTRNVTYDETACASFDLMHKETPLGHYVLRVPGAHNVSNAVAALALGHALGISEEQMQRGLLGFRGTERRFQYKGSVGGVTIVDDYAHHPTEIRATLQTARRCAHHALWCVFQPHTYSRTKAFLDDFAEALSLADHVVLADIYAARETDDLGISSEDLRAALAARGTDAHHFSSFDEIETYLLQNCVNGDLLITMGAGDIGRIGERLLGR